MKQGMPRLEFLELMQFPVSFEGFEVEKLEYLIVIELVSFIL